MEKNKIEWNGSIQNEAVNILYPSNGKIIVSPTKVGYIIMATDYLGLEKKFQAKKRKNTKPAVVLCSSIEQLKLLAKTNETIVNFYQIHWDNDILLGCILPWSDIGKNYLKENGFDSLVKDQRETSCFVIRFGRPSEFIVEKLWNDNKIICFASSANPSGLGNMGKVSGIGDRIEESADLIICADDYVKSIQPKKSDHDRYEQGVMVSLVDDEGNLINEGNNSYPVVIRKGLDIDKIMLNLTLFYNKWDYRHGQYY